MKIPKYWARGIQSAQTTKGKKVTFSCWHWSDVSVEEAKQKASARANTIIQKFINAEKLDRYSYGDRPPREEIVQVIANQPGQEIGIVTRNAYGALILNAAKAIFIDIDFPKEKMGKTLTANLLSSLGKPAPNPEELYCQGIAEWGKKRPELGIRVYRTFAGLRCLITNVLFEPGQKDSLDILHGLGSDPLYIQLCKAQECFRARLTAKPWRCGISKPPSRYPWENVQGETNYRQWEKQYSNTASQYVACRLIKQIGPASIHPEIEPILSLHDRLACSDSKLALA